MGSNNLNNKLLKDHNFTKSHFWHLVKEWDTREAIYSLLRPDKIENTINS